MSKLNINAIALAVSLALSGTVWAEGMSKEDYKAGKDRISAEYTSAKTVCGSLSGNAKDICMAEAKGKEKVGLAEHENAFKSSAKTMAEVREAKAEADYTVAKERCDDLAGNPKDVCIKEAKAAEASAKADAKAQMKTSDANATAREKTSDARKDARSDKVDAQYSVAKEKCDSYSGDAKDKCLEQAKTRTGK